MHSSILQTKKTALVTGANKGIGKEVVRQLAGLGYQVYLGARDEARGQETVNDFHAKGLKDVHLLVIDVSSDESVKRAAETLATKIGALDVLVNNAGIVIGENPDGLFTPVLQETLDAVKATYEVNVYGVIRATQAFLDLLKKSKSARIVNVGSALGSLTWTSNKDWPFYNFYSLSYSSSKTALNGVTLAYAKALAEFNIKVNVSDPGYTSTDLSKNDPRAHSVEVGATSTVHLATLPDDGPTNSYENKDGIVPW